MASYLTLFPTVETPLDESGKWLDGARDGTDWANPRVTSVGFCCGNQTGTQYADVVGLIKPAYLGFGNDQWAWGKVTNSISSGEEEVELRLRSAISSGSCTGYEILFPIANGLPSNNINIVSWDRALGSFNQVLTAPFAGASHRTRAMPCDPACVKVLHALIVRAAGPIRGP